MLTPSSSSPLQTIQSLCMNPCQSTQCKLYMYLAYLSQTDVDSSIIPLNIKVKGLAPSPHLVWLR